MRILHVSSEYPPQEVFGLGRYVCELARESVRQGHVAHVLTNSIGGVDQDVVNDGVAVHRVDFPPPPKPPGGTAPALAFNLHLLQRAQRLGYDAFDRPEVVVSHDWLTATAGHHLAKRWGVPHVWTVHDTVRGKSFGTPRNLADVVGGATERWACQHADLILVNSQAIREETLLDGADAERIRLVPCGIDPDRFVCRQSSQRLRHFRQLFAAPDEVLLTFVGRLDVEKGVDTLIDACTRLERERLPFRLAIVGKGILAETIQQHLTSAGLQERVRLCGYLSGEVLRAVYAISDIHVCPSHYEPFGIVALEAMAAARTVVVSDTGGLTEIVSSPEVGCRVAPRDASALAENLANLIRNPARRRAMGVAAALHVRKRFAWSSVAKLAIDQYSGCIAPTEALA